MSLPARQQEKLDGIEARLRVSAPHLAAMFAIFTRLTNDEGPALTERLRASRWRAAAASSHRFASATVRDVTLVVVAVAMIVTGVVLGGAAHGAARCVNTQVASGREFFELNCQVRQHMVTAK
jgi:hypothetical protein